MRDPHDPWSVLGDFADRNKAKLLLHSVKDGTHWVVEVKGHGSEKDRSVNEAARKLCDTLGLDVKTA